MKSFTRFSVFGVIFIFSILLLSGCPGGDEVKPSPLTPTPTGVARPEWAETSTMVYLEKPEPILKPQTSKETEKSYTVSEEEKVDLAEILKLLQEKKSFEKELKAFEKKYKDSPNIELAYYSIVQYYYSYDWGKNNADIEKWCKRYIEKFPKGKYSYQVVNYYYYSKNIYMQMYTQSSFTPKDKAHVYVSINNIKQVVFIVYKVDNAKVTVPFQSIDPYSFNFTEKDKIKEITKIFEKKNFYGNIELGQLEAGLYVVKAKVDGEDLTSSTIVSVSQVGIISKSDNDNIFLFVVDKTTGAPVKDAKVTAFSNNLKIATGTTDKDGVIRLECRDKKNYSVYDFNVLVENDISFINVYNYSYNYNQQTKVYFYPERPVYRPAQKVQFKMFFRDKVDSLTYSIPSDKEFKIVINNPNGEKVYEKKIKTNEYGSVNDSFDLADEASLGWYNYLVYDSEGKQVYNYGYGYYGYSQNQAFRVEEYKKPEFKMTVNPVKSSYIAGDELEVNVDVKYYFGEAVKNGEVEYWIYQSQFYIPYWYYYPYKWYYEDNYYYGNYYGQGTLYKQGKTTTDSKGQALIKFKSAELKYDANYTVKVRVTDKSRRMIEGTTTVKVAMAEYSISLNTDKYIYKPGDKVLLNFSGKDILGNPVPFEGEIKITKYVWRDKKGEYVDLLTEKIKTEKNGSGVYEFETDEKGNFYVTITAKDRKGRDVIANRSFYVADYTYNEYFNYQTLNIILDKDSYEIGDKGTAVIQSPFNECWGILTFEGDGILGYKMIKIDTNTSIVDFEIKDMHSPNFYISLNVIKDNKINAITKNVVVPPKKKFLDISIASDKQVYKPGEEAEIKVTVKDGNGKPVICELSLGMVDSSLYYIQEEFAEDLKKFYFNRIWNQVRTNNSFYIYYYGRQSIDMEDGSVSRTAGGEGPANAPKPVATSVTMEVSEKSAADALGFVQDNGGEKEPEIREYFPDTAFWNPVLVTDADGVSVIKIKMPDTLTSWRTTVRGISLETQVGMSTHEITTFKPLLVRLQLPRFITQDDHLTVSGIVHNYLKTEKNVRAELTATGVKLETGASQKYNIAPTDDYRFDWMILAEKPGEAEFILKGLTDEESDAMKLKIPILPHGLKRFDNNSGVIKDGEEKIVLTVNIPETAILEASELNILTTASLAGTMFDSLEYLIGFPYGCVEQTMSRFLPDVMVAQTIQKLGLKEPAILEKLPEMVEKGLQMLYDMQHYDGGWGW
ncbi:MAG: alpha-2-macroglobulin family protein, partial [bacterium]|nr:alpha-2-macroglobulin family protein [bacterium]